MTSLQSFILQTVEKIGRHFQRVAPAGHDTVIFYAGADKTVVQFFPELNLFQVLRKSASGVSIFAGIPEISLENYI